MAINGYERIDPDLRAVETFLEMPFREESKRKILWDDSDLFYDLG